MADDTNSENKKNEQEASVSKPKKGKRSKSHDRVLQDIMKKATLVNDLERNVFGRYDAMRAFEESTYLSKEMQNIISYNLPDMLGLNSIRETLKLATETARDFIKGAVRYPLDELNRYQEILRDSVYFRPLKDVMDDLSEKYDWIDSLKINPVENALEKLKTKQLIDSEYIFRISTDLKNVYANLPSDEITFQDDQTIVYDGKAYGVSEIKDVIDESLEAAGFYDETVTRKDIDNLTKEIQKIKETPFQKVIWIFICIILSSIFNQPIQNVLRDLSEKAILSNKTTITKYIRREMPKIIDDKTMLKHLRFVTTDVLNVRKRSCQRSELLGRLCFKDIVIVLKKKKNWTFVEWQDQESDSMIRGWVFTRYLKKFEI